MSPWAHMTHNDDPSQAFVKQIPKRRVIADGGDGVTRHYNLIALLGD